jgi:hypothetical protein
MLYRTSRLPKKYYFLVLSLIYTTQLNANAHDVLVEIGTGALTLAIFPLAGVLIAASEIQSA